MSKFTSKYEVALKQYFEAQGYNIELHSRQLIKSPLTGHDMELDLWFPELQFAIEVNGIYWHSFEHLRGSDNWRKWYHHLKSDLCEQEHIQLVQLWEDDLRINFQLCCQQVQNAIDRLYSKSFATVYQMNRDLAIYNFLRDGYKIVFDSGPNEFGVTANDIRFRINEINKNMLSCLHIYDSGFVILSK